jgi:phosphoglycolate phosphatase-like HAD superfamily hydrolase
VNPADLKRYNTLVFDCDGVILDSNKVKAQAFFVAALPYGEGFARALVAYNQSHGGISRYIKFRYFLEEIVGCPAEPPALERLLKVYASEVRAGLLSCSVAPRLSELRCLNQSRWLVVSGGDQSELREVFDARKLTAIFDGGIFGSPDSKDAIMKREIQSGNISPPTLFIGDSAYDHSVASDAGVDFAFLSAWSEFTGWKEYQREHGFVAATDLAELFDARS